MLGAIFERFVEQSPMSVMVRGLMERVFAPEQINPNTGKYSFIPPHPSSPPPYVCK